MGFAGTTTRIIPEQEVRQPLAKALPTSARRCQRVRRNLHRTHIADASPLINFPDQSKSRIAIGPLEIGGGRSFHLLFIKGVLKRNRETNVAIKTDKYQSLLHCDPRWFLLRVVSDVLRDLCNEFSKTFHA
ncbi:hypothetical protein [Burkholderia lata]|uniref:hypothetical protein n=1 Tax=Burkholderia lata (strain ATCC 17760 / DSM 23089 / LMG 22485 / NCIMB 9086 / R18194 / 383) TaxID=482957 RepID=UPI001582380D|nr:hypothetical protein [Burkholderia lata]